MNNLPTATQLLIRAGYQFTEAGHFENTVELMIEFAKLHVQEVLQKASEQVEFDDEVLIRQSILQSYPLELIK